MYPVGKQYVELGSEACGCLGIDKLPDASSCGPVYIGLLMQMDGTRIGWSYPSHRFVPSSSSPSPLLITPQRQHA